ncbi:YfkD family protein [Amphibacillus indicireducens]|uniref:YfkD famly protein n=1 Tax=Amphibacillus indicireducens TaxID=1076330 RepID=A0ABP7VMI8_9BACI
MRYILALVFFFCLSAEVTAEVDLATMLPESIPSHVQSIETENTAKQTSRDLVEVEATELTKKWLDNVDLTITNPNLIEQLNATEVNRSIFAFGYSSEVYLGRWPLSYQSTESSVNWAYQKINDNFVGSSKPIYVQEENRLISGGIQNKVTDSDQVQNMILANARERIQWPIDFEAHFGANTNKQLAIRNESGADRLEAYAAAVKETGTITYGEVYLTMTGRKQELKIKNIVEEQLTTWLPIQNHLAFHLK